MLRFLDTYTVVMRTLGLILVRIIFVVVAFLILFVMGVYLTHYLNPIGVVNFLGENWEQGLFFARKAIINPINILLLLFTFASFVGSMIMRKKRKAPIAQFWWLIPALLLGPLFALWIDTDDDFGNSFYDRLLVYFVGVLWLSQVGFFLGVLLSDGLAILLGMVKAAGIL